MPPQGETVDRMRVRCAGTDPLNVKLRLSSLFQGVDLRPASLAPGAILKIRHFADPLPGRIRVSGYMMFPPEDWRRAASAAIDEIARTAVRPYRTLVPAGAQAVVFQDEAELVACMAGESVRGSPAAAWWWAGPSSQRGDLAAEVIGRLRESPRLVPAVVEYLARSDEVRAWVRDVETDGLLLLAEAVVQAFALPPVWRELMRQVAEAAFAAEAFEAGRAGEPEPWFAWAPEACAAELSRPARFFVGWMLTLQRSPAVARSQAFAGTVQWWVETAGRIPAESSPAASDMPEAEPAHLPEGSLSQASAASPEPLAALPEVAAPPAEAAKANPPPVAATRMRNAMAPVRTGLGGLFYLVNYAIYAGFYGDFTQPLYPCLPLPVWDFIELLGRALLLPGEDAPEDPVWPLLAELSGREEGERAGARFDPPEGLEAWVDAAARAARERLSLALQLEDQAELAAILIARSACVYAGPANVDVVFALADLPIAVRYAGLDRDPGWVPAAGRTLAFHFE
jgi:hypothetical protein